MLPDWRLISFDALTNTELYKILQLRTAVFVVEQQCIFQDMDDRDLLSQHLYASHDNRIIACSRIVPPGISYTEPSIGRIATDKEYRGFGIGRALVERSIEVAHLSYGNVPLKIGAQLYLKRFYESFGFRQQSEIYMEDGIEHIHMILS